MHQNIQYGIRLFILYGIIWFIDLLDATLLNVALPAISMDFHIGPTEAQWALIGFLLATVIGMIISTPISQTFGLRRVFLLAQWVYLCSSLACGITVYFSELVFFRVIQGFAGGLAIPLGMFLSMSVLPHNMLAKVGSWTSFCTFVAPAMGPILTGYVTHYFNWRWLFLAKLPVSLIAVLLSHYWVKKQVVEKKKIEFDWPGFIFATLSLSSLLLAISVVKKPNISQLLPTSFFVLAFLCGGCFLWWEKRAAHPLVPLKIFRYPLFTWGNLIQSSANIIFLGSTFLVATYFQRSMKFSIILTGWIMGAVTLGMMAVMPLTAKYYNRWGPLPFIIPGLLLLSGTMFAFIAADPQTSPWLFTFIIFCVGAGSAAVKTSNFVAIFTGIPHTLKSPASSLYSIFKQIAASIGIAVSSTILSIGMDRFSIDLTAVYIPQKVFVVPFAVLGSIPLLALPCCLRINNTKARQKHAAHDHLETEFEEGAE